MITLLFLSGKQTIERLKEFIENKQESDSSFLQDIQEDISESRVEDHIIRNISTQKNKTDRKSEEVKLNDLKKRITTEEDETLFLVIHDEAHYSPIKGNLVDRFINDPTVSNANNLILLQVSATPYCLLTKNSRIPRKIG